MGFAVLSPSCVLKLETLNGRRLQVREDRLASAAPGAGMDDPHGVRLGTPGRNLGISGPSMDSVLSRSDTGGALWQLVYIEGEFKLKKVSVDLKYWPDRTTNPELVIPDVGGLKQSITQADAK